MILRFFLLGPGGRADLIENGSFRGQPERAPLTPPQPTSDNPE